MNAIIPSGDNPAIAIAKRINIPAELAAIVNMKNKMHECKTRPGETNPERVSQKLAFCFLP